MKYRKSKLSLLFAAVLALSGCGSEGETGERPEDTPYNDIILETEKGYYYNAYEYLLTLRYKEKESDSEIFLCAKPECRHNGEETCTATYKFLNISNMVMYDDGIYFVADDRDKETIGTALYKVSFDGSSLDKIGDVKKVKYKDENNGFGSIQHFLIHKGYAYIAYNLGQYSYSDFIEDGLVKMNIETGEVETIISSGDDYFNAKHVNVQQGVGDYVYYSAWGSDKNERGDFRYNIKDGSIEKYYEDSSGRTAVSCISKDAFYLVKWDEEKETQFILEYDMETKQPTGIEFEIGANLASGVKLYDNKFFVIGHEKITVYDTKGKELAVFVYGEEKDTNGIVSTYSIDYNKSFDISNGKLYMIVTDWQSRQQRSVVSYCYIEDILNGTAKWEKAYVQKSWEEYWDEDPMMTIFEMGG